MNWQKKYSTLQKGDKVEIVDCPEIRRWSPGKDCIGKTLTMTSGHLQDKDNPIYICNKHEYGINFTKKMLKRSII